MDAAVVSTRLRRSTPSHDAYTVRVFNRRVASLATARPADARRWVATTRWLHGGRLRRGRLVVGLGVQSTPSHRPATLQLCVGHRCLVFHLARADAVPEALRRFLADPRVSFVGSGAAYDSAVLWVHCGIDVARAVELRSVAGMGNNASVEQMAHRFLGYPGMMRRSVDVAMSELPAPRLSLDQVQYASVDAYLAFRLGVVLLCPDPAAPPPAPAAKQRATVPQGLSWVPVPMPAVTSAKVVDTDSDYDGRARVTVRPVRAFASDSSSEYTSDYSSEWYTDEEDEVVVDNGGEDEGGYVLQEDDEEGCSEDGQEDEDAQENEEDDQEDGGGQEDEDRHDDEGDQEDEDRHDDEEGVVTDDKDVDDGSEEEFAGDWVATSNVEEEDGGHSEAVLEDGDDDWDDVEVDYGCDQEDEVEEFEEFYLL